MFESPVPELVKINWQPMKAHWHWVGAVRAPQINHAGISSLCVLVAGLQGGVEDTQCQRGLITRSFDVIETLNI